jgi:hypothetical protein
MEVISVLLLPEGLLQLLNMLPTIKSVGGSIKNTRFRYNNKGLTVAVPDSGSNPDSGTLG